MRAAFSPSLIGCAVLSRRGIIREEIKAVGTARVGSNADLDRRVRRESAGTCQESQRFRLSGQRKQEKRDEMENADEAARDKTDESDTGD